MRERPAGDVVETFEGLTPNYEATCKYNEGTWWLELKRQDSDAAGFRCTVTDPLGGGGRKEFAQAGTRIILRFPDDFEVFGLSGTKQPWGNYQVKWEVFLLTEDKKSASLDGEASCDFNWQPFVGAGTMPQPAGSPSSQPNLRDQVRQFAEELGGFYKARQVNRPNPNTPLGRLAGILHYGEVIGRYDNVTIVEFEENWLHRLQTLESAVRGAVGGTRCFSGVEVVP